MSRMRTYVLTGVSVLLFVLLTWIFADGLFSLRPGGLFVQRDEGDVAIAGGTIWTYALIALILLAGVLQARQLPADGIAVQPGREPATPGQVQDPGWWRLLLGNVWFAIFWLPIRFFVGREWLIAGEHKIRDVAWRNGEALVAPGDGVGFWERVVAIPEPPARPSITYGWFRDFLQFMIDQGWNTWFGPLIAFGEVLIGIGLLVGALVGIAAFFGSFMNFNFLLAGTASSNPVLFGFSVFLILAWKVAGYWGLDRWLLPALGAPWSPGFLLRPHREAEPGMRPPAASPA